MTETEGVRSVEPRNLAWFARLAYAALGLGIVVSALEYDHVAALADPKAILVTTGIVFLLFFLLVWQTQRGRNWARWLYLVLFVIGIPFYLPQLVDLFERNAFAGALSLLQFAMQVVALVLVFTGDAKPFFAMKR